MTDNPGYVEPPIARSHVRDVLALTEASIANADWLRSVRHSDPAWWFGYRAALQDLLWDDG